MPEGHIVCYVNPKFVGLFSLTKHMLLPLGVLSNHGHLKVTSYLVLGSVRFACHLGRFTFYHYAMSQSVPCHFSLLCIILHLIFLYPFLLSFDLCS